MSSCENPLSGDQGATAGVVEVVATLVLQRRLRRTEHLCFMRRHGLQKNAIKGLYLPGPAVLTDILSTDHPGDDGLVGGQATPVG